MPKINYQYTHFAINNLLEKVKKKAKLEINSIGDCETLSVILSKAGFQISKDTLGRLYNVIKSTSMPSKYTLNLLAEYIDYKSWDEYFKSTANNIDEGKKFNNICERTNESELTLLNFCIHDNAYNPIINYLKQNLDIFEYPYTAKSFDILNLFDDNIRDNFKARYKLLEIINNNEVLRSIYFKYYVNIDGLNNYYAEFIEKKYLNKLNPINSNFKLNYIWANSVLITSYLYANHKKKILKTGYDLFKKYIPEKESLNKYIIDGEKHYYPYSRFHHAYIIYLHLSGNNNKIVNIIQIIFDDLAKLNEAEKSVVLAQIFEALTVAEKPEIILSFSNEVKSIIETLINFNEKKNETESIIQMCFYYLNACKEQDLINLSEKFVEPLLFDNKNYINNYSFYYNSLRAILTKDESYVKSIFKALEMAKVCKNKFHIKIAHQINQT